MASDVSPSKLLKIQDEETIIDKDTQTKEVSEPM